MSIKYRPLIRSVTLMLLVCFGLEQVGYAAPINSPAITHSNPKSYSTTGIIEDPSKIDIPFEYVALKEIHKGTNGKLIIHVQDAHANLSGQQSLSRALDFLMQRYDIPLVLVEGGDRDVTLDEVKRIADQKTWKRVAKRFLYEGIVSGEEYLNLTTDHPMTLMGIEYPDLYEENLRAYASLKDKRKEVLLYLRTIQNSLNRLKNRLYPKELLEYEDARGRQEHKDDFAGAFDPLMDLAQEKGIDLNGFKQIPRLITLKLMEAGIDFDKANLEQNKIIEQLIQRGMSKALEGHLQTTNRLNKSQISQHENLNRILDLVTTYKIKTLDHTELSKYREYTKGFSKLSFAQLFEELEMLETRVYQSFLKTDELGKIRGIDQYLNLLRKAYNIQLTSREFSLLKANQPIFVTASWQAHINEKLKELKYYSDLVVYKPFLEETISDLMQFYFVVDQRDHAFLDNAQKTILKYDKQIAFLIAGGYHTQHLTEILRDAGYSYIVLTPQVTFETDHEKYEAMILSSLEQQSNLKVGMKTVRPASFWNALSSKISPRIRKAVTISHIDETSWNKVFGLTGSRNVNQPGFPIAGSRFDQQAHLTTAGEPTAEYDRGVIALYNSIYLTNSGFDPVMPSVTPKLDGYLRRDQSVRNRLDIYGLWKPDLYIPTIVKTPEDNEKAVVLLRWTQNRSSIVGTDRQVTESGRERSKSGARVPRNIADLMSKKKKVRSDWQKILEHFPRLVAAGRRKTVKNVAAYSQGRLTAKKIHAVLNHFGWTVADFDMVPEAESVEEIEAILMDLILKAQAQNLTPTMVNLAAVSNQKHTLGNIENTVRKYRQKGRDPRALGMVIRIPASPRTTAQWESDIRDKVEALRQRNVRVTVPSLAKEFGPPVNANFLYEILGRIEDDYNNKAGSVALIDAYALLGIEKIMRTNYSVGDWTLIIGDLVQIARKRRTAPNAENLAFLSNGVFSAEQISDAIRHHDIDVYGLGVVSKRRTKHQWEITLALHSTMLPAGRSRTPRSVAKASKGIFRESQIIKAIGRFKISYAKIGMEPAFVFPRSNEKLRALLISCVTKLSERNMEADPIGVAELIGGDLEVVDLKREMKRRKITFDEVGMIPRAGATAQIGGQRAEDIFRNDSNGIQYRQRVAASSREALPEQAALHKQRAAIVSKAIEGLAEHDREIARSILDLMADGMTVLDARIISEQLGVSEDSVKQTLSRLRSQFKEHGLEEADSGEIKTNGARATDAWRKMAASFVIGTEMHKLINQDTRIAVSIDGMGPMGSRVFEQNIRAFLLLALMIQRYEGEMTFISFDPQYMDQQLAPGVVVTDGRSVDQRATLILTEQNLITAREEGTSFPEYSNAIAYGSISMTDTQIMDLRPIEVIMTALALERLGLSRKDGDTTARLDRRVKSALLQNTDLTSSEVDENIDALVHIQYITEIVLQAASKLRYLPIPITTEHLEQRILGIEEIANKA